MKQDGCDSCLELFASNRATRVNKLALLQDLYSVLYLPDAVWNEVVLQGHDLPGATAVKNASWIRQASVKNTPLVLSLTHELGAGEAEAIVLARRNYARICLF